MTTAQDDFYGTLTAEINKQVEPLYGLRITLIVSSSQGDFHWFYENVNGVFNQGTFDYVSARVSPGEAAGTAEVSPAGGFPNAYIQVATAIYYALSPADTVRLQEAVSSASAQATVVVRTYEGIFGSITDLQLLEGQAALGETAVANKQDYVIGFVMGYLWSGRREQNQPALAYTEMAAAPNLPLLLPGMPPQGSPAVGAAQKYLALLGPANELEDWMFLGGWTIAQLRNNTARPGAANGGMKTVNPNTGAVSPDYQVGYGVGVPIPAIQKDLDDPSRVIRAVVEVEWSPSPSLQSLLFSVLKDESARGLMSLEGTGKRAILTIDYPGFTLVPAGPAPWSEQKDTGWFDSGPIAEANRNTGQPVTGFHFTVPPAYNLGPLAAGGDFGLITHLLISNTPTVIIHFPEGDLERTAPGTLALMKGRPGRRYTVSWSRLEREGGFTLVLRPATVFVPPLQQTAYVIGGAFDFPGVTRPAS